jgi:hypothetical protein
VTVEQALVVAHLPSRLSDTVCLRWALSKGINSSRTLLSKSTAACELGAVFG